MTTPTLEHKCGLDAALRLTFLDVAASKIASGEDRKNSI
jgi:hypothetical protein